MFARIKRSAGRAYLVVVENERVHTTPTEPAGHRQRELARLGRVDHLSRVNQDSLCATLTSLVGDVRAIRPKHGRGPRAGLAVR